LDFCGLSWVLGSGWLLAAVASRERAAWRWRYGIEELQTLLGENVVGVL
jgi:hypothetical protein